MSITYVRTLDEPGCSDPREFGGKAAGLARLAAAGLPVAPGFAVATSACRAFLDATGLRSALDPASPERAADLLAAAAVPDDVAEAIRQRYARLCADTGADDVEVAVRSSSTVEDSATASFAGEFSTWLDVSGADDVVDHVRRCWAGLFTARAGAYARARGVDLDGMEMAVVVQKTVRARAAGVMFTVSPVTGDRSRIVIEASWGLGIAVVGGEVTPDRWIVDKVSLEIVERRPGDKRVEYLRGSTPIVVPADRRAIPCLDDEMVLTLARLGKRIEREQGHPQDIEFAVDGDGPVLLQMRAETVWSRRVHVPRFAAGASLTNWIVGAATADGASRSLAPVGHQHDKVN
ncbi:PEP/pyruvate-binding domain-containing protein [Micromonospora sp. DT229]|uniref:PEP/pyruvate-binding domain-containing protein n=1 Tax=Micromonospora sp. DT229 TaxID=3393430 RepID=UPI003CF1C2CA